MCFEKEKNLERDNKLSILRPYHQQFLGFHR